MIVGPKLFEGAARQVELIRKRMEKAEDQKKSYDDLKDDLWISRSGSQFSLRCHQSEG